MKNKDIEKKLMTSLEDKSQLDFSILVASKHQMKEQNKAKQKYYLRYALAGCILAVVCLVIVLPIIFTHSGTKGYEIVEYSSMSEYFLQSDIKINTFSEIYEKDSSGEVEDGADSINFPYKRTKCELIKAKDNVFCIEESYEYIDGAKITVDVVLNSNEKLEGSFFSDYLELDKKIIIAQLEVEYSFDTAQNVGKSKFTYNGYDIYMSFNAQSEDEVTYHIEKFINFQ